MRRSAFTVPRHRADQLHRLGHLRPHPLLALACAAAVDKPRATTPAPTVTARRAIHRPSVVSRICRSHAIAVTSGSRMDTHDPATANVGNRQCGGQDDAHARKNRPFGRFREWRSGYISPPDPDSCATFPRLRESDLAAFRFLTDRTAAPRISRQPTSGSSTADSTQPTASRSDLEGPHPQPPLGPPAPELHLPPAVGRVAHEDVPPHQPGPPPVPPLPLIHGYILERVYDNFGDFRAGLHRQCADFAGVRGGLLAALGEW